MGVGRLEANGMVAAFKRDWALGCTLGELAALYGYRNINSVTRAAQRLELAPRPGGREPLRLKGGSWQRRGLVSVWVEEEEAS